ncbi:Pentatricopeptide repeat-containing protein [Camellia lanceoleosa]|uniref:Pentatricopeptide repeat-containing protein n=1 Tax=Camellia lanceoleosa TaxID=1840588 RepID=A0ACC0G5C3_9ERIC|nr:Pentatricopeptide repeat-containing protein [Camellia lanceoleosa]
MFTYSSVLRASHGLPNLQQLHSSIIKTCLDSNVFVRSALIDSDVFVVVVVVVECHSFEGNCKHQMTEMASAHTQIVLLLLEGYLFCAFYVHLCFADLIRSVMKLGLLLQATQSAQIHMFSNVQIWAGLQGTSSGMVIECVYWAIELVLFLVFALIWCYCVSLTSSSIG